MFNVYNGLALNPFMVGEWAVSYSYAKPCIKQPCIRTAQSRFAPPWVNFTPLSCFKFLNLLCGRKCKIYNVTILFAKTLHMYGYVLFKRHCNTAYITGNSVFSSLGWYPVVRRPSVCRPQKFWIYWLGVIQHLQYDKIYWVSRDANFTIWQLHVVVILVNIVFTPTK